MCEKCKKKKFGTAQGTGRVCGHRTNRIGLKYCAKCAAANGCCACCGRSTKAKASSK